MFNAAIRAGGPHKGTGDAHDPDYASTYPMAKAKQPVPKAKQPVPKHPLRVFLVEDLPVVRNRVIESVEEIAGVKVVGFAENEEYAISWLGSHQCDVLILDLQLRQGNGLGILKALEAPGSQHGLVKIVYSNYASPDIRRLAERLGASHFFDKTLDTPKLRVLLERLAASVN